MRILAEALTFDDVSLVPAYSNVLPKDVSLSTRLTRGDGRDRESLQAIAGPHVTFTGRVSDQQVREELAGSGAFLFPGEEDFGISMVEALAAGAPVIALDAGGARDIVRDGVDGILLAEPGVESLRAAVTQVAAKDWDRGALAARAAEFSRANFAAQAQTHGAVVDLLEARNLSDLARRVDDLARARFGLAAGVIALEADQPPAGWRMLVEGQIDMIIGHQNIALMGFQPTALGLFGDRADEVKSIAMVRMAIWEPARQGLIAFGSADEQD